MRMGWNDLDEMFLAHQQELGREANSSATTQGLNRNRSSRLAAIELRPIPVRTGSHDREGRLALADGDLVAVFVRLDDEMHGEDRGRWFLEAAVRPFGQGAQPLFDSLDEVEAWCRSQLLGGS